MAKVCKRHADNPVMIYHQCVGCELEWFREELEQKQQEIEQYKQFEQQYNEFIKSWEKYQQDRDKLIEVLREVVKFDYHTNPDIHYKRLAREILEEIGVTVEPDRLHDARVKIAKARFSPERLISEREKSGRCEF